MSNRCQSEPAIAFADQGPVRRLDKVELKESNLLVNYQLVNGMMLY